MLGKKYPDVALRSFKRLSGVPTIVMPRCKVLNVLELRKPNWIQIGHQYCDISLINVPLVCSGNLSPLVKFISVMSIFFLFILFKCV